KKKQTKPRATADPGQAHDRPPRRKTTPTAYQLSSPPARTPPHTHPGSRMESPRERDLSVAARLNPAPDAPRQSDEHPNGKRPLRRRQPEHRSKRTPAAGRMFARCSTLERLSAVRSRRT